MAASFDFSGLGPSKRLHFEIMSPENGRQLYALFQRDANPFVDSRFKEAASAREYVDFILDSQRRFKHAACDWFIKNNGGQYVGILHLYELSRESGSHRCFVGYALASAYRKQGIAREAVSHLIDYVFEQDFGVDLIQIETRQANFDSLRLLQRLNCIFSHEKDGGPLRDFYYFIIPVSHWQSPGNSVQFLAQLPFPEALPPLTFEHMADKGQKPDPDQFTRSCQEYLLGSAYFHWHSEAVRQQALEFMVQAHQEKLAIFFLLRFKDNVIGVLKCYGWGWLYEREAGIYEPGLKVNYCLTRPITFEIWQNYFSQLCDYIFENTSLQLIKVVPSRITLIRP